MTDKTGMIDPNQTFEYPIKGGPHDGQMVTTRDSTIGVYRPTQNPSLRAYYKRVGYEFHYQFTEGQPGITVRGD